MKKKIILIISVFSLLAVAGGAVLISSIGHSAANSDELLLLHQVEIQRGRLLQDIHRVQADLYSLSTRYPESIEATLDHVSTLEQAISHCFSCHHEASVTERLSDLQQQIGQYSEAVNGVTAHRRAGRDYWTGRELANTIGDSIIGKVNTMLLLTDKMLVDRREHALSDQRRSRFTIFALVVAGPLMVAVFGFTTLGSLASPMQTLLDATKRLQAGDLDTRVEGLHDEFAELADAFNRMAGSLRERLRELAESERRYRLLFESAADAIFIIDAEGDGAGRIVAANQAAAMMHGYTVQELITMRIQDIDAPEAAKAVPVRLERILDGERINTELDHAKKDGTVFPVEISAAMFTADGHRYVLAIDRDITERKRMAEALQRAERLRTTGELAAGLAHEIKNPLAGISVTMEALSGEGYLTDEDKRALRKVIDEIRHIDGLIKGLLNFARPPKPQLMNTDVNTVLESAVQLVLHDRRAGADSPPKIDLVKTFAKGLPEIVVDPMQLKQVFINLLLNAVDAVADGGAVILTTSYDEMAHAVVVSISDTGKGIDIADEERIFQPFFTTKAKGTGLGLAISKRLIEEQGGMISIESRTDRGATFRMSIPCDGRKGVEAL